MSGSRLTSLAGIPAPSPSKVPGAAFRRLGGKVLVTADSGEHAYLSDAEFSAWLEGRAPEGLRAELMAKGLDREQLDFGDLAARARRRHLLDWPGPNVHTLVVTQRCNFGCGYCHASIVGPDAPGKDMSPARAKAAVDFIFSTPNPELMLEFQGGEPLLNWPVVRFVAEYASRRAKWEGRRLHMGLISNFSLLDEEKIRLLAGLGVSFCTSLDGPAEVHDENRRWLGGSSHAAVVEKLKGIQALRKEGLKLDPPNAICTVTRRSLPHARAIVDQAVSLGLERIQLGPLDRIGFAAKHWDELGYEPEAYVAFYREALDHLIALNRKGVKAYEKTALIFLLRILEGGHWRFPNGDGLCRLAYNHDGGIYASEEGRLLAHEGDEAFRVGRLGETGYREVLDHPAIRAALLAQNVFAQPMCSQCAYGPYCTVGPVANYRAQGSVWGRMPENAWCRTVMGIFDLLFERLAEPESRKVLESWLAFKDR